MGYALWTPSLIPKGCFLALEEGHQVVRCDGEEALHRAKSLEHLLCEESDDVESQKGGKVGERKSFMEIGRGFVPIDMER
ncbi:hypothetical protein DKX38_005248 [Salix brachista]|uniref:Uncharacterized protein n=1 Tax=Salix brachista TaxID=2182728 RepID=A0A5N5NCC4_9ROSI|nr:hypothetical protein DKX38_005248 [Salix brachista]